MKSWVVNFNEEFVKKYDMPLNSFIIKAEEEEDFLCKLDRVLIKVKQIKEFKIDDVWPFNYLELPDDFVNEYTYVSK